MIVAVIVTYEPALAALQKQLDSLVPQVSRVIIVDNGSTTSFPQWLAGLGFGERLAVFSMQENLGIGAAQNIGIEHARSLGATHVVLFDQDSQPAAGMIDKLLSAANQLARSGIRLAAVGPRYKDSEHGEISGFVRVGWSGFKRVIGTAEQPLVEVDFLIASGVLIPLSAFESVGLMDGGLFIDHVDTEWCFRARSKGLRLFGAMDALMIHTLGDQRKKIWFLRWRNVSFHSPFRYYYMFRNSVILQRRVYMPLRWKIADLMRDFGAFVFFGIFSAQRLVVWRMMLRGISDGLRGVTGKLK
ncbi:glycosyltransferase family 2 protein [Pseudomonas sp. N040]|uniref:glycosyltransferase family 2 protein n=1 Tax=Pseudomonas sp. N040 TaxID=2785325 RepID=UPI0018A2D399|nr:glycosyltransferase family 2 protein [Pseudomonas sp. N040]MBF7730535.1 glycosyltransferase family 2 protein [Pseudomonas sp. N040]MBW7014179.1 glycosyltransferase family 2 protein [Pseudomonas sp. N040]